MNNLTSFKLNVAKVNELKDIGIRHLSFDFWNTLATANPKYGPARNYGIADRFGVPEDVVKETYTTLKHELDTGALGITVNDNFLPPIVTVNEVHKEFAKRLGLQPFTYDVYQNVRDMRLLFRQYPPTVLAETVMLLHYLSDHFTISIGSNTNFISGNTIEHTVLDPFTIPFKFTIFSDLVGFAKPDPRFYNRIHSKVMQLVDPGITINQIMHIGDSILCDHQGPARVGMSNLLIMDPQNLISHFNSKE